MGGDAHRTAGGTPALRNHGISNAKRRLTEVRDFAALRQAHIQTVNLLRAFVPHQQRRVVGCQPDPELPGIEAARNLLQAEQAFHFAGGGIHAHQVVGFVGIVLGIKVLSIV